MNKRYSLHKISGEGHYPFSADEYSWFKFGDKQYAQKFAQELFEGFMQEYGDILLKKEHIVILPSPYLSIPTASNFLSAYFKKEINNFLFHHNKSASVESKIHRNQTYVADYGNLDFEERLRLISNDTYYIDKNFINGKFCIFVDDIKITGSHEHTVHRILEEHQVRADFVFVYFAELINKNVHPSIENHFNYYAIKDLNDIIEVMNRKDFQYNTRIVKYILSLGQNQFFCLLEHLSMEKRNELFHLAIGNNYHQIVAYKHNIRTIKNRI